MDIKCPHCGATVGAGTDFCPSCMEQLPVDIINQFDEADISKVREMYTMPYRSVPKPDLDPEKKAKMISNYEAYMSSIQGDDRVKVKKFMMKRRIVSVLAWCGSLLSLAVIGLGRLLDNFEIVKAGIRFSMILIIVVLVFGIFFGAFRCPFCHSLLQKHFKGTCGSCGRRLY